MADKFDRLLLKVASWFIYSGHRLYGIGLEMWDGAQARISARAKAERRNIIVGKIPGVSGRN